MFSETIKARLRTEFCKVYGAEEKKFTETEVEEIINKYINWLNETPDNIVFRINTLLCDSHFALNTIEAELRKMSINLPNIRTNTKVPEMVTVGKWDSSRDLDFHNYKNEVIIDSMCGVAVLRGANIFAPGILGMPKCVKVGDRVSIYVDVTKSCKKGSFTKLNSEKIFVGNGTVEMTRDALFSHKKKCARGIAVKVTETISRIPQLNESVLPKGFIVLQQLPSIICSRILDPQPHDVVLDMCAAPGNKTTHIAAMMEGKGTVIALEKVKSKINKLNENIKQFSCKNVSLFNVNAIDVAGSSNGKPVLDGPPFSKNSFEKILLDAPCSGLGQRPQLSNFMSLEEMCSYPPMQKKLFCTAVKLLKPGGTLVYSTCTITISENEGIVAWALKTYPELKLECIGNKLEKLNLRRFAREGYHIDGLSLKDSKSLCRFDFNSSSIGFFIACFIKSL